MPGQAHGLEPGRLGYRACLPQVRAFSSVNKFDRWDAAEWDLYLGRKVDPVQPPEQDPEAEALQVYIRDLDEQILTGVVKPPARTGSFEDTCIAEKPIPTPVSWTQRPLSRQENDSPGNHSPEQYKPSERLILPPVRWCACGCGAQLDDRPNKRYVSSRHRWRDSKRRKSRLSG
jgi:hypothetical protein